MQSSQWNRNLYAVIHLQEVRKLAETKGMNSRERLICIIYCGKQNHWRAVCMSQLPCLVLHSQISPQEEKSHDVLLFGQLSAQHSAFICLTATFHIKLFSNSGNTKKEKGEACAKCWLREVTVGTSPYATAAENKGYYTASFCMKPMCSAAQRQVFLLTLKGQTAGLLGLRVCITDYLLFKTLAGKMLSRTQQMSQKAAWSSSEKAHLSGNPTFLLWCLFSLT